MACNHTNIDCGCKDSFLTTPSPCPTPDNCPEAQPCSEVFDAQCIVYTGDPIVCNDETVVDTNTNVADALQQVVTALCTTGQCCPTFVVDIVIPGFPVEFGLEAVVTNGTAPFTYEWSYAQNDFRGIVFNGPTTNALVILDPATNKFNYGSDNTNNVYTRSTMIKVKVTDSVGQIATAYYHAVRVDNAPN